MPSPREIADYLLEADSPVDPKDFILQAGTEREQAERAIDLNFDNAQTAQRFYHKTAVYSNRITPVEARRNGKTKTWKTRPGLFAIPIKVGMYEYGNIDNFSQRNADEWQTTPPEHPEKMPRIQIRF